MTFLGLERPVEYGRELVFDPTTALMVLNANKDYINAVYNDYQQALSDMKEFNKEYGDFLSPIAKDMDWYDKHVTGNIRDFINELYAQGIDPLRSSEGRALITRKLATMDKKGIAKVRLSAKAADEYLKNMAILASKGKYNADVEKLAGRDLSSWDTMGGNGVWGASSPVEYEDLNEYTGHIFDKMQDEYINTIGGYDYSGVSRERRAAALTSNLGGIMNSDLGRFHYAQSKAALEARLGREATDQEAMAAFLDDILTSTVEYEHRKREENKEYARQRDFYYDNKLDAEKQARSYYYDILPYADTNGDGQLSLEERAAFAKAKQESLNNKGGKGGSSSGLDIYADIAKDGLSKAAYNQVSPLASTEDIGRTISQSAILFGEDYLKNNPNATREDIIKAYKDRYTNKESVSPDVFNNYFAEHAKGFTSSGIATEADAKRLITEDRMVKNTLGSRHKLEMSDDEKDMYKKIKDNSANGLVLKYVDGETYTAPQKDGTVRQYVKVHVYSRDAKGNVSRDLGEMYYNIYRSVKNNVQYETKNGKTYTYYPKTWRTDADPEYRSRESSNALAERTTFGTTAKDVNEEIRIDSHRY